jgi:putative ABC transport system permease protein
MRFVDLIATAWLNLWAHRLRAALSILGVVIGIGSFAIMYSVGEGAKQETLRILKELGSDVLSITLDTDGDEGGFGGQPVHLTTATIDKLLNECPSLSEAAIKLSGDVEFTKSGQAYVEVYPAAGVSANYLTMFKQEVAMGRLFHEADNRYLNPVCILGNEVAEEVFPNGNPMGRRVAIKGYLFTVVGVLRPPERMLMALGDLESEVLIPLALANRLFAKNSRPELFVLANDTGHAMLELQRYFYARLGDDSLFSISSQRKLLQAQEKNVQVFQYVLWAIGSISLLVGGIGIMNIMLVSVTERLREIGIRRALGASRRSIVAQFLMEALLLCLIGAAGGTIVGYFGADLVGRWTRFTPAFSLELLLLSLAIAAAIGIIFGTYPAFRAAKLEPSRVLRYE